jgi:hypothetical protein
MTEYRHVTELRRGRPLGSLHGAREGQRDGHGAAALEEEAVEPPTQVREGGRERGRGLVGQLSLLGRSGPKGRMAVGLFGLKVEGKIVSE